MGVQIFKQSFLKEKEIHHYVQILFQVLQMELLLKFLLIMKEIHSVENKSPENQHEIVEIVHVNYQFNKHTIWFVIFNFNFSFLIEAEIVEKTMNNDRNESEIRRKSSHRKKIFSMFLKTIFAFVLFVIIVFNDIFHWKKKEKSRFRHKWIWGNCGKNEKLSMKIWSLQDDICYLIGYLRTRISFQMKDKERFIFQYLDSMVCFQDISSSYILVFVLFSKIKTLKKWNNLIKKTPKKLEMWQIWKIIEFVM